MNDTTEHNTAATPAPTTAPPTRSRETAGRARAASTPGSTPLHERADALAIVNAWVHEHADEILVNGGALPDELAALLDDAALDFAAKLERVAAKVRELKANAAAANGEKDYYAQREKMWTNAAAALTAYAKRCLELAGETKVETALGAVRLQANPWGVRHAYDNHALCELADAAVITGALTEEGAHPLAPYVEVQLVATLNTKALLNAWKDRHAELLKASGDIYPDAPAGASEEDVEAVHALRGDWVLRQLDREFPGVAIERGRHVRFA